MLETPRPPRSRPAYALLVAGTIALGLASRRFAAFLPALLQKNAGDALYATMTYWGLALLAPRARPRSLAATATGWCFAVELAQLYHAPAIDTVRATRLGALVLGSGFRPLDLVCYVVGVGLAVALESAARRR